MADYTIKQSSTPKDSDKCECTHPYAAHSSNGMICGAACDCKVLAFDPRFPASTEVKS